MSEDEDEDALTDAVRRHHQRLSRARRDPVGSPWRTAARVGALGWVIALPPTLGALLGHVIDRRVGGGVTWALALMLLGLAGAASVLWRELAEAHRDTDEEHRDPDEGQGS